VEEDRAQRGEPPDLTEEEVLAWADAFFQRTGDWPKPLSGPIQETPGETWLLVAAALALGVRGFPTGGSVPRLLEEHRGRYNQFRKCSPGPMPIAREPGDGLPALPVRGASRCQTWFLVSVPRHTSGKE